jgi:hypothetical protein
MGWVPERGLVLLLTITCTLHLARSLVDLGYCEETNWAINSVRPKAKEPFLRVLSLPDFYFLANILTHYNTSFYANYSSAVTRQRYPTHHKT